MESPFSNKIPVLRVHWLQTHKQTNGGTHGWYKIDDTKSSCFAKATWSIKIWADKCCIIYLWIWQNLTKIIYPRFSSLKLNCLKCYCQQYDTCQLPIWAGHCQWGGLTDRNICNMHGDEHLAWRYQAPVSIGYSRSECYGCLEGRKAGKYNDSTGNIR